VRILLGMVVLLVGCGGPAHSQSDLDRAKAALEIALDSWKQGEVAAKLRSRPEPITFVDDDQKTGHKLVAYEWDGTGATDREMIRFTVKLSVQDRKGKKMERSTTYAVALKNPIAIGRDPYF